MNPIGRPNDNIREKLSKSDIDRICELHRLSPANQIVPESRGNEGVAYHLDSKYFIHFIISDDINRRVETLILLNNIEEMPTPKLIAWSENEPKLNIPYMVVEKCPGNRLDSLWKRSTHSEHIEILEALGVGTARYHTVTAAGLTEIARKLGLNSCVQNIGKIVANDSELVNILPSMGERLHKLGIKDYSFENQLIDFFSRSNHDSKLFIAPGLVHTEPFAEHFFMQNSGTGYSLSGCVDLEFDIRDSIREIVAHYVTMLCLDNAYYEAFRRGYERYFAFPPNADEQLRNEAAKHDLRNIIWLLNTMEKRPDWSFASGWLSSHIKRLEGWLNPRKKTNVALFREDIGPW